MNNLIKILIAGEGGQGIQQLAQIIAEVAYEQNLAALYMPHYGVEMRMGISLAFVQIGSDLGYPKFSKADIVAILADRDLKTSLSFVKKDSTVINAINLKDILKEENINSRSLNMLVLGILIKEYKEYKVKVDINLIKDKIREKFFASKNLSDNFKALELGLNLNSKEYLKGFGANKFIAQAVTSADNKKSHTVFNDLCKGCGLCIQKCPKSALKFSKDKINFISQPIPEVDIEKCIGCGICQNICPDSAIRLESSKD